MLSVTSTKVLVKVTDLCRHGFKSHCVFLQLFSLPLVFARVKTRKDFLAMNNVEDEERGFFPHCDDIVLVVLLWTMPWTFSFSYSFSFFCFRLENCIEQCHHVLITHFYFHDNHCGLNSQLCNDVAFLRNTAVRP